MALTAGTKLGAYEILSAIGAGGMGEVYRARDSKLKREVAIKILPDEFNSDHDRVSRFQREAEVLASLNHPNIASIHDLQEASGARFLVLELVEGETLAERIARGPVPVDEALGIAKQICEALEAAHERGVVHRDLKPANIKVTPDGKVKVLDFGLAKAFQEQQQKDLSNSPTMISGASVPGVILGTAAYMSPEQARGKTVDKRADIWAFGVVLYEMVTGRQLFQGDDLTVTLAAVVMKEPDLTAAPVRVRRVLARCLEKDPKKRLRDISGVELLLDEVSPPVATAGPDKTARLPWAVATVCALVATVLGISLWAMWRGMQPADRPLVRLDVDLGADVSLLRGGTLLSVALSPDGTRMAYSSGTPTKLFTRRMDQLKSIELPGTEGAAGLFFSPDGQWIGFNAGGKLKKISVQGGAVVPLADIKNFNEASWGEDGNIIVADRNIGLVRVPDGSGAPEMVAEVVKGDSFISSPQILPGGKAVLFSGYSDPQDFDTAIIEVMTLVDHHRKVVVRGGKSPRYLATSATTGHLVYNNKATLFAVPFDLDKLEIRGTAVPILDDVVYSTLGGEAQLDVSRPGTLVYQRGYQDLESESRTLAWIDAGGKTKLLLAKPGHYGRPSPSPDGQRLALEVFEGARSDIWLYDWKRDTMTRLTFTGIALSPVWSPDGRYIVFRAVGAGMSVIRSDGAGQVLPLTESKNTQYPWSFAHDGKRLAFIERGPNTLFDLWTVPMVIDGIGLSGGKPEVFLQTPIEEQESAFSPDGRWLAYASTESGRYQVYVRTFPDKGGKWQISNSGGQYPMWSSNGHELFFESLDQRIMAASYAVKGDSFVADKPRMWFDKPIGGIITNKNVDIDPDGKRIIALMPANEAKAPQEASHEVTFLLNFFDELRRRVPLGK